MTKTAIHTVYKTQDGQRVPSVTTYLGVLAKPALIDWAWKLGVEGLDYKKVRDQAGDTGTIVHYLILCDLEGKEPDLSDYSPNDLATTANSMDKFRQWKSEHTIEPIMMEVPIVSEKYRFGGTPDFYGWYDGTLTLLDFKTSGDVYEENFCQLAAYVALLTERNNPVDSARIIRLGKRADEGVEEVVMGRIENYFKIFLNCQEIYELRKVIRKENKE